MPAEPDRIVHEVADAAVEVVGSRGRHCMGGTDIVDLVSHVGELIGNKLQRACDIDERHRFKLPVVA